MAAAAEDLGYASKTRSPLAARARLGRLFDGASRRLGTGPDIAAPVRGAPARTQDTRIGRAISRLSGSKIGADIYGYVQERHGNLEIMVDDDPSASYDARLIRKPGGSTLYLTRGLVERESPEVVAAYVARELSDLYFENFPASVERRYMAQSNMVRVYAEMTQSGLARDGYRWDTSRDRRTGKTDAMRWRYESWRQAVSASRRSGKRGITRSAFFGFVRRSNDAKKSVQAGYGLEENFNQGSIYYEETYRAFNQFDNFISSERAWLADTGRTDQAWVAGERLMKAALRLDDHPLPGESEPDPRVGDYDDPMYSRAPATALRLDGHPLPGDSEPDPRIGDYGDPMYSRAPATALRLDDHPLPGESEPDPRVGDYDDPMYSMAPAAALRLDDHPLP
ncbi:MAG: hypothetical protein ABII00_11825 [Elusimicrobiota bacterium]